MKKNILVIVIVVLLFLMLLSVIFFVPTRDISDVQKGTGMSCFKICSKLCYDRNSSIMSWGAIDDSCSCSCKDYKQAIFKIV